MLNKEQMLSIGISSEDADRILAQYKNSINVETGNAEIKKQEVQPLTNSDITTSSQLLEYAKGQLVRLPDFAPDQPFIARLKRPSMLVLVKSGKIPNALLQTASSLFDGKPAKKDETENTMGDMYDVLKIIAEASLVVPTMEEIKNSGIELTDEQLIAIFNYSQQGVEGLKSFRE